MISLACALLLCVAWLSREPTDQRLMRARARELRRTMRGNRLVVR